MYYAGYAGERQLGAIMALVDRDLSEPYSIFTYRYFLNGWPDLCVLVRVLCVFCVCAVCALCGGGIHWWAKGQFHRM